VYYPRVPEQTQRDASLTDVAEAMLGAFHVAAPEAPPLPARDLTLGQMRLMFLLLREGPQPMGRIAEVFDLSSTASTGFVARVERHGLVERRHRSDDRRVVECALTEDGTRFLQGISGMRLDLIRQRLAVLDPGDLAEFGRLLQVMRDRAVEPVAARPTAATKSPMAAKAPATTAAT
jgi:DNA-binding MarR family transcriptional regulator